MKKYCFALIIFILYSSSWAISLQEAYQTAEPQGEYDRWLSLQTGVIYHGGLWIGKSLNPQTNQLEGSDGEDVFIQGNGAILDLNGSEISINYCNNCLDIIDCIIINGDVHFRGESGLFLAKPTGSISYCTFYNNDDYGVRLMGAGDQMVLHHNIFANALETGDDYTYLTGFSLEWIPTGINVALSGQGGLPDYYSNWSWFSDQQINADSLLHCAILCDYG